MSSSNDRCPNCHRAYRKDRSVNQNKYYWGCVVKEISDYTGFDTGEVHEIIKSKFLKSFKEYKGHVLEYTKSTTDLTTTSFDDLMIQIRTWASQELGIFINLPNEDIDA